MSIGVNAKSQSTNKTIGTIPLPKGFERIQLPTGSFGEYLRTLPLKKDKTVYLYNGRKKFNQSAQYAVVDISTGNKDLQQCADALMRLRSEYFFLKKDFNKINFKADKINLNFADYLSGTKYTYKGNKLVAIQTNKKLSSTHEVLMNFLETVFINCGTYTVDEMCKSIVITELQPGDIYVKGGAPGHAMLIVDAAYNKITKQKIYLLLQSYMPAQDMHIVVNPSSQSLSPWYEVNNESKIYTPEWTFYSYQLKRWK